MELNPAVSDTRQYGSFSPVVSLVRYLPNPVFGIDVARLRRFLQLSSEWKAAAKVTSSAIEMAAHAAYREIVEMGPGVVPFILDDLHNDPHHWFIALGEITHANPVKEEDRGRVKKMAQAWVDWGRANGYA